MARPERSGRRGLITLLTALLLCGVLSAVHRQAGRTPGRDPVPGAVRDAALVPAQLGLARFARWWQVNVASFVSSPRLARENVRLQAQVVALTLQNQQLQMAQAENHRLRALLRFQDKSPLPLLAAEVVALKPRPELDTMTLARGLSDGVRAQTVVLAPNGALVGQVVPRSASLGPVPDLDLSYHSCSVLLLTDSASSVGAQASRPGKSGPVGIVQGDRAGHLLMTDLPRQADVLPGDSVTTSGLGGVYPKNIPIGTVLSVTFDAARSLKTARVRPAADFDHLQEAFLWIKPPPVPDTDTPLPEAGP